MKLKSQAIPNSDAFMANRDGHLEALKIEQEAPAWVVRAGIGLASAGQKMNEVAE